MATTDTHATTEELLEEMFSVRSVPKLYNEGQLPLLVLILETAVRRVGGWCEMAASLRGRKPGAGERPLVKIQQTEMS
jgi:hypothetical protein